MTAPDLEGTARSLVAKGKGILAADESFPTIQKRFEGIGLESTEEHRRAYREMLFTAPGIEEALSGVILFDETIRDQAKGGTPLPEVLSGRGIIPGIKADTGAVPLAGFPGEKITQGLDGLHQRLAEWRKLGARFTKWRAVITIGDGIPTGTCLQANAEILGRFADELRIVIQASRSEQLLTRLLEQAAAAFEARCGCIYQGPADRPNLLATLDGSGPEGAEISVPIEVGGSPHSALALGRRRGGRAYGPSDRSALQGAAAMVGEALLLIDLRSTGEAVGTPRAGAGRGDGPAG